MLAGKCTSEQYKLFKVVETGCNNVVKTLSLVVNNIEHIVESESGATMPKNIVDNQE